MCLPELLSQLLDCPKGIRGETLEHREGKLVARWGMGAVRSTQKPLGREVGLGSRSRAAAGSGSGRAEFSRPQRQIKASQSHCNCCTIDTCAGHNQATSCHGWGQRVQSCSQHGSGPWGSLLLPPRGQPEAESSAPYLQQPGRAQCPLGMAQTFPLPGQCSLCQRDTHPFSQRELWLGPRAELTL